MKATKGPASTSAAWVANSLEDFSESSQETTSTAVAASSEEWRPKFIEDFSADAVAPIGDEAPFKFTF